MKDYYKILGLEKTASGADIKNAYYRLVRKYHPDLYPHRKEYVEKFLEISEAYNVLGDLDKRLKYSNYIYRTINLPSDLRKANEFDRKNKK
jgi:curved DNA-binding protein